MNQHALTPFLNEVREERVSEINRIADHINLSLTELLQKVDEEIGKAASEVEKKVTGAEGRLAQAENRHAELMARREKRRQELEQQRALTLQSVERMTSILVLPHPERSQPEVRRLQPDPEVEATTMQIVEEEVRGYRDALKLIHEQGAKLSISEQTIKKFHRLIRGDIWDAGKYKEQDSDIIEKFPDERERVRFKAVAAAQTPTYMGNLVEMWRRALRERWVHPLIVLAGFNLDFLCIHPFRYGNGRVSKLLLWLQCYHLCFEVGRYISVERLIEENKERYDETLEQSSRGWHEGKHDPWPYVNYLLYILKSAYKEFEERVGQVVSPKGAKTELVLAAIRRQSGEFRLADVAHACPGVGRDWIRVLLAELKKSGEVTCRGKGPAARWRYTGRKRSTVK